MKYAVLIGDGMADDPADSLGGRTPLEYAETPCMDTVIRTGCGGCVETIPEGCPPGSSVACMSIFGYDPSVHFSGRGPLEAGGMGIDIGEDEFAFRCNLVNVDHENGIMADYSSGHISTEEGRRIIQDVERAYTGEHGFNFHPGVGYRHLFVIKKSKLGHIPECTPPHDIMGKLYRDFLPQGEGASLLLDVMHRSESLLKDHPVNTARRSAGKTEANMLWLWSGGVKPGFVTFQDRFGLSGYVISAVDLVRGIAFFAGVRTMEVPGITGYYDTNYTGKAEYAVKTLKESDIVFVHVEAPDEASHNGDMDEKIRAIENFDRLIVGPVHDALGTWGDYRVLVMPDHYTPISTRTHREGPVPAAICGTGIEQDGAEYFSEKEAAKGALQVVKGYKLIEKLVDGSGSCSRFGS